jgi:hypothetical protein
MTKHLDEQEISAAVAGLALAAGSREHLCSCLECRRRVADVAQLIDQRRAEQAAGEPDWEAARAAVLARLPAAASERAGNQQRRWWRPLAAAAAVLVAAVAMRLLMSHQPPAGSVENEMAVEEILAEVEAVLADDSVPGFELIDPGIEALSGVLADSTS